jgi:hypothetical protein
MVASRYGRTKNPSPFSLLDEADFTPGRRWRFVTLSHVIDQCPRRVL